MEWYQVVLYLFLVVTVVLNFWNRKIVQEEFERLDQKINTDSLQHINNAQELNEQIRHFRKQADNLNSANLFAFNERLKVVEITLNAMKKVQPIKKIVPAKKGGKK